MFICKHKYQNVQNSYIFPQTVSCKLLKYPWPLSNWGFLAWCVGGQMETWVSVSQHVGCLTWTHPAPSSLPLSSIDSWYGVSGGDPGASDDDSAASDGDPGPPDDSFLPGTDCPCLWPLQTVLWGNPKDTRGGLWENWGYRWLGRRCTFHALILGWNESRRRKLIKLSFFKRWWCLCTGRRKFPAPASRELLWTFGFLYFSEKSRLSSLSRKSTAQRSGKV